MKKILSLRHWQLFILIIVFGAWVSPSPLQEICNGIAFLTFIAWVYSISFYGKEKIIFFDETGMNFNSFRIHVFVILISVIVSKIFPAFFRTINTETFGISDLLLLLVGLYIFYSIFQVIVFTGKMITMLIEKRKVSFGDYFPNLILICFLFVGIWILQPKLNKIFSDSENSSSLV